MTRTERLEVALDEQGFMRRVYLKCKVIEIERLVQLQARLREHAGFVPTTPDDFHLTLFHYGKPQELHAGLRQVVGDLDFGAFMGEFYNMLAKTRTVAGQVFRVRGFGLNTFGDEKKKVVALIISATAELLRMREEVLAHFCQFLSGFDVGSTEEFMKESSNLRYQTRNSWQPHITLGMLPLGTLLTFTEVPGVEISLNAPVVANIYDR